jgi:hypothetical protein
VGLKPNKSAIYTSEHAVGHFKTVVVLGSDRDFIVTDIHLKTIRKVEGM